MRRLTGRSFKEGAEKPLVRLLERFVAYIILVAGFVYALAALHVQIGPLVGALGIGGIALAFALQDILHNLVAGVILQARRPIRLGDQVEVGHDCRGTVRDIDLRTVLIRTYDDLGIYVPNKTVLENAIVNYTISPNRRFTLDVRVAYGTDLAVAKECLLGAARSVEGVLADPAPAAWVVQFDDSWINLALVSWSRAGRNLYEVRSGLAMAVDARLREAGIELPFPSGRCRSTRPPPACWPPAEPTAATQHQGDHQPLTGPQPGAAGLRTGGLVRFDSNRPGAPVGFPRTPERHGGGRWLFPQRP